MIKRRRPYFRSTKKPFCEKARTKKVRFTAADVTKQLDSDTTVGTSRHENPIHIQAETAVNLHEFDFPLCEGNHLRGSYARSQTYKNLKGKEIQNWRLLRDVLCQVSYENLACGTKICCCCNDEPCVPIRCVDCGPSALFCESCLLETHRNLFLHKPEVWEAGNLIPYQYPPKIWRRKDHPVCGTAYCRSLFVLDVHARIHRVSFQFCECEAEPVSLLRHDLWSSSPIKPQYAYSVSLMENLVSLQLEACVSLKGFLNALGYRMRPLPNWKSVTKTLYKVFLSESVEEYRHFHHRRKTLQFLCPEVDDGGVCPACPKVEGNLVIAMDANFGLVRKKSSGQSQEAPKRAGRFFIDNDSIQHFLSDYSSDSKPAFTDCSNFQAGDKLRSKVKNVKLDVRGVFGASCRHELPLLFCDLQHGERLGYPVFLIKEILEKFQQTEVKLNVLYDIACILSAHIKKSHLFPKLGDLNMAIPVFHCYGHKSNCQVMFNPRRKKGFGLMDGELMERLWSYLRPFGKMTKEMSPSHRRDLLADALLNFAEKKSAHIEHSLVEGMKKAESIKSDSEETLLKMFENSPVSISVNDIRVWDAQEKASLVPNRQQKTDCEWQEKYVTELQKYFTYSEQMAMVTDPETLLPLQKLRTEVNAKILKLERQFGVALRWRKDSPEFVQYSDVLHEKKRMALKKKLQGQASERTYLLALKSRYCDGQSVAIRLSRQINKVGTSLKNTLQVYNNIFGTTVALNEVTNTESELYMNMDGNTAFYESPVPAQIRSKCVQLFCMMERADEEVVLIKQEMSRTRTYLLYQRDLLQMAVIRFGELPPSSFTVGALYTVRDKLFTFHNRLNNMCSMFSPFIGELRQSTTLPDHAGDITGQQLAAGFDDIEAALEEAVLDIDDIDLLDDIDEDDCVNIDDNEDTDFLTEAGI